MTGYLHKDEKYPSTIMCLVRTNEYHLLDKIQNLNIAVPMLNWWPIVSWVQILEIFQILVHLSGIDRIKWVDCHMLVWVIVTCWWTLTLEP